LGGLKRGGRENWVKFPRKVSFRERGRKPRWGKRQIVAGATRSGLRAFGENCLKRGARGNAGVQGNKEGTPSKESF